MFQAMEEAKAALVAEGHAFVEEYAASQTSLEQVRPTLSKLWMVDLLVGTSTIRL